MAKCGLCAGAGLVTAGGIDGQLAGVFGPRDGAGTRTCGRCGGTGQVEDAEPVAVSIPTRRTAGAGRTASHAADRAAVATLATPDLADVVPGHWLVEVHGYGRILAVMRFTLDRAQTVHRFDARCDYGGPPGWEARGTWTVLPPGQAIWLSGTQSSPYFPPSKYHWGATLDAITNDLLRGESISDEPTIWRRTS